MSETFNDQQLITLARSRFFSVDPDYSDQSLKNLFSKKELDNKDRNRLLGFLAEHKYARPLSMREMKSEIFSILNYETTNSYTTTVSRTELEVIYNFIKGLKK